LEYGADVLRLWVAQCGIDSHVHIGPTVLADCRERLFRVNITHVYAILVSFSQE